MKISNKIIYTPGFSAKFKTEDVLRFVTQYPYKNKTNNDYMVKELCGIDLKSDEFLSSITDDEYSPIAMFAVIETCSEKILQQNKDLQKADSTFDATLHLREGRKKTDDWFKEQIKKLGEAINLEPFTVSTEEIKAADKNLMELIGKIF